MAHNVTGASIQDIYDRINDVDESHPLDANTFSDWSMEAGDMVTVKRGEEEYKSPVHSSKLVWRGTPLMTISSTGNKERDAVSKVSRKKYGRGGAAVRSQEYIYKEFHSEDGYLHSVLAMTESYLRTEFADDMNSLRGEFEITASGLRTEFEDGINSLHGELELTASGLRTEFTNEVDSLRGEFDVTASGLRAEFEDGINSLHGELEVTASGLRTEFTNEVDSLRGEFDVTASGLRAEFEDGINSLHGELEVTASGLRSEFTNEVDSLRGEFDVTASGLRAEFENGLNSLHGELEVTASGLRSEFSNEVDSLRGEFEVTASGLRTEFENGLESLHGELEVTASGLRSEFTNEVNSLRGEFDVTASGLRAEFENGLNSLHGEFEVTASGLRAEFEDGFTSLHGEFETTASGLRSEFTDEINSVSSRVTQQANKIALVVDGNNNIKAAQIALAINEAGSSALISADNITLDAGTTKISDVLTVRSGGGTTFKTDPVVFGTSLSTMVNISQGTVAAYQGFTWNTTQGTKTVTGADLLGMVKTMTKNDSTGLITVTLFDGSSFDFRHAASGGDYVTGDWSGGVLTVSATPTGEDSFIRTFKCGTVSWQSDKKAAYVNVTAVRTSGGSTYDEPDVFQVYVPTTESFNAGRNFYLYSEGWNNSGKLTIGAKDTNSGAVISGKSIDRTVTGGTPSWNGGTVTVPIRAYYGSTPPTYENTNANIVLNLSITDDGNNAVKLKNGNSDTGYTYTHNKYSSGQNDMGYSATWGTGSGANVLTVSKQNGGTKTNSTFAVTAGTPSFSYNSSTHKYSLTGTALVNNTQRASAVTSTGTEAYDGGVDDGKAAAGITATWGTGSGANVLTVSRELSSSTKSATYTVTAGTPTVSYNSSTHKYSITGTALVNNSQKASAVTSTGTEAYDGGVSDGKTAAGISANWGTGSGANVLTVSRALSSSTKSATYTVTAGTPTYSYNSSTHKYSLTGTALVNNSQKASAVTSTGTEAWDAGVIAGNTEAGISESWGTGSGANVLTVSRALSGTTKSKAYTITAGVNASYNSSTHKYSLTGTASVNSSQKASAVSSTGTEAWDAGHGAGWDLAYGKMSIPVSASYGSSITVKFPSNTHYNQDSAQYDLSVDNSYAYIKLHSNANTVARVTNTGYTNGYTNGSPNGTGTVVENTSGTTWKIAVKRNDGTEVNTWIDCRAIYNAGYVAGWAGYYTDSHWDSSYYNSSTQKYECWIPSKTVTWNGSGWTSAWDYSGGSNGWFQYTNSSGGGSASYALGSVTAANDWPSYMSVDDFFGSGTFKGEKFITFPASRQGYKRYIKFKVDSKWFLIHD